MQEHKYKQNKFSETLTAVTDVHRQTEGCGTDAGIAEHIAASSVAALREPARHVSSKVPESTVLQHVLP